MSQEVPVSETTLPFNFPCRLSRWCVCVGDKVCKGTVLASCVQSVCHVGGGGGGEEVGGGKETTVQVKSSVVGVVKELMFTPGDIIQPGSVMVKVERKCQHNIVVFDMCADCGLNLRNKPVSSGGSSPQSANIMAIHDNAGIRISQQEAEVLALKDKLRLLRTRKLTLVADLDQTLIHTSTDPHIESGLPDVYGFRLGGQPIVYHCRLRPHVRQFLEKVSKLYELHVFTIATKDYAAAVIDILDPEKHLFCDRIITRDEFFDPRSKAFRFKSVFPCGDSMVAIIDDREDVWGKCPNLVHVKPYVFFSGTSDINAPPPLVHTPAPPSSLPATPTTPRPFFGGAGQEGGVVPQDQPRPFKMRHIIARRPTPQSNLSSHSLTTESSNGGGTGRQQPVNSAAVDRPTGNSGGGVSSTGEMISESGGGESIAGEMRVGVSSTGEMISERVLFDGEMRGATESEGDLVSGVNSGDGDRERCCGEFVEGLENSNNNNNNNNNGEGAGSDESGDEGGGDGEGGRVENGGGGKEVESNSSSSGSGSDSDENTSSSGSSSDMDDSQQPQQPVGEKEEAGLAEDMAERVEDRPAAALTDETEKKKQVREPESEATTVDSTPAEEKPTVEIEDTDSFLLYLGDVLERIHATFYSQFSEMLGERDLSTTADVPTPDLKTIVPETRQSVLHGAKILFTGVIPTNIPPQRSPIWNTARAFGAVVHDKLVPGLGSTRPRSAMRATTHVIAGKSGTVKLKEARRMPGIKVVNPRWLWSCAEQWKWLDERLFPVESEETGGGGREGKKEGGRERTNSAETEKTKPDRIEKEAPSNSHLTISEEKPKQSSSGERSRAASRLDSRLSVSDGELEKMEAEVEAEMMDSSSSSSEGEGEVIESSMDRSFEEIIGSKQLTVSPEDLGRSQGAESRKRKHGDVDDSSCSNSPQSNSGLRVDSGSSSDDDDDALAALLAA